MQCPTLLPILLAHGRRSIAPDEAAGLEAQLGAVLERCEQAWPDLAVPRERFLRHLAERLPEEVPLGAALAAVHAEDLYLACACALGLPGALSAFERQHLAAVPTAIGHLDSSAGFVDEVLQMLREKLFVAPAGSTPKIADYAGTGALQSWVRIAALRIALDLVRSTAAHRTEDQTDADAAQRALPMLPDPEIDYIKDHYRDEFRRAVRDAFASLRPDQRNLLRLHYIDGLNIDRLGALFRVHRSTAARWLAAAAAQILDETRRLLRERLHLSAAEFDSLAEMVRSQLELNIASCLQERPGTPLP
ncbi:MAG: sigma-70 family RNA polymerase sigma factor [Myxococcales bacterium]|nr:sigma-70 family RNA polymerase sigma factor [Myxococcota bacterium]MDW8281737.1 sigma-70 family RNA polymerase sigma factor [Myxococcales bacterium]